MPSYSFDAMSPSGATERGALDAESEAVALDTIARRGLIPISLTLHGHSEPWWNREVALFEPAGRLPSRELERIFSTLAALLQAQLPLPRALAFCENQTRHRRAQKALAEIRMAVENGSTLWVALRSVGQAFPERFIVLAMSGESADRLAEVTRRIAAMMASEARLLRTVRGSLFYPIILLAMSIVVMAVIVFHLAPTLLPVFDTAGAPAPTVLVLMAQAGELAKAFWPLLLIGLVGAPIFAFSVRTQLSGRFASLLFVLPVSGPHMRRRETLRFCQIMLLMLGGGVVVLQAIAAAKSASTVPAYRALLSDVEARVTAGGTLVEALRQPRLIDEFALTLIAAGEEGNRLVEGFQTAVDILDAQVSQKLNQAIQLIAPAMTLAIGLAIGAIILATVSAIMDLNDINF